MSSPGLGPDNIDNMFTVEKIQGKTTTPVNAAAPYYRGDTADQGIEGTGSLDAIEVCDIEVPGFDSPDVAGWFCRRRNSPIKRFVGLSLPGFAMNDQILPQIHREK